MPADSPAEVPGAPAADRFWAEVHPIEGRLQLFRLYPGNVIHRGERALALAYSYGGVANWPGFANLHTNQAEVTYRDSNGVCHSNGAVVDCGTLRPACNQAHVFCAPIELISVAPYSMPDVVIQLSQRSNLGNAIIGCRDAGDLGLCRADGACPPGSQPVTGNSGKVDCRTSLLTSPIPGGTMGTAGCSYCYGNAQQATGDLAGLKNIVLAGTNPTVLGAQKDVLSMLLQNDNNHSVTITVRYATPMFDQNGSQIKMRNATSVVTCATRGLTRLEVTGGGFGPPGACLMSAVTPFSCPEFGPPGASYFMRTLSFPSGSVVLDDVRWSDSSVSGVFALTARPGSVQISTPLVPSGNANTADTVTSCPQLEDMPGMGVPGTMVNLHARGFLPGESISLALDTIPIPPTLYVGADGGFVTNVVVPQVAPGSRQFKATGGTTGEIATARFVVTGT